MKQIVILLVMILIASGSYAKKTISGNSNSFLDEYQVSQVNENLYELTYANSTEKFTIEVCPEESKCCYLVRGEQVEVMYLCNEMGFGLRKMPESSQKLSTNKYSKLLDIQAFRQQSLLTPKQKSTNAALGIIACFFPQVINDESRGLVFYPNKETSKSKLTAQN